MKLRCWMLVLVGAAVFSVLGCKTTETQVKKTSPEEQAIFQLFSDMETAWNNEDAEAYISFFHDDLKLKLGSKQKPKYYSKGEYEQVLPQRMADFGPYKMVDPKILKLDGDKAKAKVIIRKKHRDYKNVFNLARVDNRWLIISNEW